MKRLEVRELRECIDEVLRMVEEEGETIEITRGDKVIAHIVPVYKLGRVSTKNDDAAWADLRRLAEEIGKYPTEKVDAVEIVRDLRREL